MLILKINDTMNIYLFIIVCLITVVGWVWFFIRLIPSKKSRDFNKLDKIDLTQSEVSGDVGCYYEEYEYIGPVHITDFLKQKREYPFDVHHGTEKTVFLITQHQIDKILSEVYSMRCMVIGPDHTRIKRAEESSEKIQKILTSQKQ